MEGPHAIAAARASGALVAAFATEAATRTHAQLLDGIELCVVSERTVAGLAGSRSPQGVIGVARLVSTDVATALRRADPLRLVAVLVAPADPGNAGTVVRAADAAGADAVLFAGVPGEAGVDPHNDKCVRASAGSVFSLPIGVGPVQEVLAGLRHAGASVLAADMGGEHDLDAPATGALLAAPTGWLFGNEAHGLGADLLASADARVRIPLYGRAESLNLAAAAALCLYASARVQRSVAPAAPTGTTTTSPATG